MSSPLLEEAARIASQFEYPAHEVQRGVKEYIREIDEGLSHENTTLSQIPTYVTSVPNGTEKVGCLHAMLLRPQSGDHKSNSLTGPVSGGRPRWHEFPRLLRRAPWRHDIFAHADQDHDTRGTDGVGVVERSVRVLGSPDRVVLAHPS